MTIKIEQAEIEALRDAPARARRSLDVAVRDFSHPRTLSKERLRHLSKSLAARLGAIANELAGALRNHHKLFLGEVAEVTAHGLFDGFVKPFVVHGFSCAGRMGWLVWDSQAAVRACEIVLSGPASSGDPASAARRGRNDVAPPPSHLSRAEARVVGSLLDQIVSPLAEALQLSVAPGQLWQEPEELTTLEDLGPDADSRRLLIHLVFEGPGGASEMRLYLPGVVAVDDEDEAVKDAAAPRHLADVLVRVSVELGSAFVPLSELLGLEVGDVIPIDKRIGDAVAIRVEDQVRAGGRWGEHRGQMAVLVEQLSPGDEEEPTTED